MTKTFKQFLEEKENLTFDGLLRGDCSDFFKRSQQNGLIVRGMNGAGSLVGNMSLGEKFPGVTFNVFKKTVRKERKPMDTAKAIHGIIDDWFEEEMGIRARSQAVFCFGEAGRENAYEYGQVAVILPIGKFTYVWSPKVADLYDDVIRKELQTNTKDHGTPGELQKEFVGSDGKPDVEAIGELMNGLGYTINGFDKAVGMAVEIMIDCDEYYVIPLANDKENRDLQLGVIKKAFVDL